MNDPADSLIMPENISGYCRRCRTMHMLPTGKAYREARRLITSFEKNKSIALLQKDIGRPELSTTLLFGEPRGKMFGVLECIDKNGQPVWLYGFSGQYNSRWRAAGWAPPLFDVDQFHQINAPEEKHIKSLTRQIEREPDKQTAVELKADRTARCRRLMNTIHDLYVLNNFRGDSATLDEVIGPDRGKPTGIGDCSAPKLLNNAALRKLTPVSMAEFYFGRKNRSQTRHHKRFYPPCTDKCEPLLGFLLCGM